MPRLSNCVSCCQSAIPEDFDYCRLHPFKHAWPPGPQDLPPRPKEGRGPIPVNPVLPPPEEAAAEWTCTRVAGSLLSAV